MNSVCFENKERQLQAWLWTAGGSSRMEARIAASILNIICGEI